MLETFTLDGFLSMVETALIVCAVIYSFLWMLRDDDDERKKK